MSNRIVQSLGIAVLASVALTSPLSAQSLRGAGSTFATPVITKWAEDFAKLGGDKIAYDSVGSGAGIERVEAGTVDFGASDKPLSPAELAKFGLCQFPLVIGAVVPVVNLPGVAPGRMKFTGEVLAAIYLGKINRWDDPAIAKLNGDIKLPPTAITVVHRTDGSGTTYNWVDFLAKSSADWKMRLGVGLTVNWPTGVGGKGNEGVAAVVKQTEGAIGYVEYSIALKNKLAFTQVQNSHGLMTTPSPDTFQAAADSVDWGRYEDFSVLMTNGGSALAYPVTATTFVVMPKSPKDSSRSFAALKFFKWALEDGGPDASELKYVPLPGNLVVLIEQYWKSHIAVERHAAAAH